MADDLTSDLHAEVTAKQGVKESAAHFIRGLVDRFEAAFNANDWNWARRLAGEVDSKAEEFGAAIEANSDKP